MFSEKKKRKQNSSALTYHAIAYESIEESKRFCNLIDLSKTEDGDINFSAEIDFHVESTSRTRIIFQNISYGDAIWVKMSHYKGWKAYIDREQLPIFLAGPDTMLVFQRESDIVFQHEKDLWKQVSEHMSLMGIISTPLMPISKRFLERRKKQGQRC